MTRFVSLLVLLSGLSLIHAQTNPVMFVTQVPVPADFTTIGSTFGNHRATVSSAARGGDLWMWYPGGFLKNLTSTAGYGQSGQQGTNAIAVRDPAVHWDGTRAIFSMVIGAPERQYQVRSYRWQLYEVTGLGASDTPMITYVTNQPADYNNISPAYGTDGRIIFTSDRPHAGRAHLYPQLDEYEEQPTVSGLWSLDPASGDLFMMEHSPSGSFEPFVDSFGRVIFTRWDHLQRDQQADGDDLSGSAGGIYGTFDYTDESATATAQFGVRQEFFPEPRSIRTDLLAGTAQNGLRFNLFFPWMINEDGTEMETLNHIGRHELHNFFSRSFSDDPALNDFNLSNQNPIENMFHISEDAVISGRYLGTDAPEFQTHSSGILIAMNGAPTDNPEEMVVTYLTHPETADVSANPGPEHSGLYRDPIRTTDGTYVAVHTPATLPDQNIGTGSNPMSRYDFRVKALEMGTNGYFHGGTPLTGGGILKTVTWWNPDFLITYSGLLWELQPVEVRPRPLPQSAAPHPLPAPEATVIAEANASLDYLRSYLRNEDLALVVVRDATTRDDIDTQQPFNLRVAGDSNLPPGVVDEKVYDIRYLQFFQGDLIRGIGLRNSGDTPRAGRRVLARPMHIASTLNTATETAPPGAVDIHPDGSVAAVVPARRAMSWQLTAADGDPVVRERFWVSFQPGEVRTCASCHGINRADQAGRGVPQNHPAALRELLSSWAAELDPGNIEFSRIQHLPNGEVDLDVRGDRATSVRLQYSTDLRDWTDVATVTLAGTPPTATHRHAATSIAGPRRFYRIIKNVMQPD